MSETTKWTTGNEANLFLPKLPNEGDVITILERDDGTWMCCSGIPDQFPPGDFKSGKILRADAKEAEEATQDDRDPAGDDDDFTLDLSDRHSKPSVFVETELSTGSRAWVLLAHCHGHFEGWVGVHGGYERCSEGPFAGWQRLARGAKPPFALGQCEATVVMRDEEPDYWYLNTRSSGYHSPPSSVSFSRAEVRRIELRTEYSVLAQEPMLVWENGTWEYPAEAAATC